MSKFYYAVCVEGNDSGTFQPGSQHKEPVGYAGDDHLGREPEYCCEALELASSWGPNGRRVTPIMEARQKSGDIRLYFNQNDQPIDYCPFCGEKIEWLEDIAFKMIKVNPRVVHDHKLVALERVS